MAEPLVSDYIREALRSAWFTVYLDGRNEHGSHVLPMPGNNIADVAQVELILAEYAEQIISEAEAAGHVIHDCVVTTWRWNRGWGEEPGYWEYGSYHADLTIIMCGTPYEQRQSRVSEDARAQSPEGGADA